MKTGMNRPKSLCKRDGKDASSACHWRNWKASESAIRPPRPSPTGITGAPTDIVSNSLADFAVNGCKDPPCCQLRSKGFSVFNSGRHCPRKFRFAPSASSVRPVLGSWLLHTRRRLLNLPHPPTGPGLKTSGSTKRSFFRTRFLFAYHYRAGFPQHFGLEFFERPGVLIISKQFILTPQILTSVGINLNQF